LLSVKERGFGRGFGTTIARELPAFAAYFGSYDYVLKMVRYEPRDEYGTSKVLFAGGMAGVNSWVLLRVFKVSKVLIIFIL